MSSTTPAPDRASRDRAGEPARPASGQGRRPDEAAAAAPLPGVAMRTLLASCAAAEAVSTPPGRRGERRTAA